MSQLITTIILVIIGAALCACLEAAFFTISLGKAKLFKEAGRRGGAALLSAKENVHRSIITLVILNNGVTIIGSIYVGHLATELYGNEAIGIVSAVLTATVIIFGEIIPKIIGEHYAENISLAFSVPVLFLTRIFSPLIYVIELVTNRFLKPGPVVSEDELKMLSRMGEAEGSIEHGEEVMIQRVFTLNDLMAKDIMTPRTVIEGFYEADTLDKIEQVLLNRPYSRYPVYGTSPDNVVGICQSRELLAALSQDGRESVVREYMSAPLFTHEKKHVDDLLTLFQTEHAHMAIVQDDFGGTSGVVTLEDVLEQLVGEIVDETDEHVDLRQHARRKRIS